MPLHAHDANQNGMRHLIADRMYKNVPLSSNHISHQTLRAMVLPKGLSNWLCTMHLKQSHQMILMCDDSHHTQSSVNHFPPALKLTLFWHPLANAPMLFHDSQKIPLIPAQYQRLISPT